MTSQPVDVLVTVTRGDHRTLGRQIEDQLRAAIRERRLKAGARVPSTRDLSLELGVSRPVVVNAYAQLAAEGFLELRQGARPRVSPCAQPSREPARQPAPVTTRPRFNFRPGTPDVAAFPRSAWLRSLREAMARMTEDDLGYSDQHGSEVLRAALSDYLGRVRGVVSDASRVVVTSGFHQGRMLVCRALAAVGAKRIAIEDPGHAEQWEAVARAGLELLPIPVDGDGIRVDVLERARASALVLTPAHHYPTGAVLSGERRAAVLEWLRRNDALALEDDYDAEYRYDRAPVGALQALDPGRIIYAGTASKTLAPALRLGWLIVPPRLLEPVQDQQRLSDYGGPRIEQHAFADFLQRGELDRHLRRMRGRYRSRRDTLIEALRRELPDAAICGIAAGLHAAIRLPDGYDEIAVRDEARRRGIVVTALSEYVLKARGGAPTILLGYARSSQPALRAGVKELAAVLRAVGRRPGKR